MCNEKRLAFCYFYNMYSYPAGLFIPFLGHPLLQIIHSVVRKSCCCLYASQLPQPKDNTWAEGGYVYKNIFLLAPPTVPTLGDWTIQTPRTLLPKFNFTYLYIFGQIGTYKYVVTYFRVFEHILHIFRSYKLHTINIFEIFKIPEFCERVTNFSPLRLNQAKRVTPSPLQQGPNTKVISSLDAKRETEISRVGPLLYKICRTTIVSP